MKALKIFVDICMVAILALLFPTAKVSPALHVFLGFAFIVVAIIHFLLNGKWLITTIRKLFSGKLNPKASYMFMLVVGLMIAFTICSYTGIVIYQSDFYTPVHTFRRTLDPSIAFAYRAHSISAIACVIFTVLHAKVHWKYLKTAFHKKGSVSQ